MRKNHFQTITLSVLIAITVIAFSAQSVFAAEITYPVNSGDNPVTYRDIENTDPTPPVTFSLDKNSYNIGETAILTIEDFCANLDVTVPDFINPEIIQTSSTTLLDADETGPNTAVFVGDFGITDAIPSIMISEDPLPDESAFISYTPDSPQCVRAKITLPLSMGGNVTLSDVSFTETELANLGIKPVIGAINVSLVDGAAFSSLPTVEISFANANLDAGDNCDFTPNPDQADSDLDGVGDACETLDTDGDGIVDSADNCLVTANADQTDSNSDGVGDACETLDTDGDGDLDSNDNCPFTANSNQQDSDFDGEGNVCELLDTDGDGLVDGGRIAPAALEMYYKASGQSWEIVTISCLTRIALLQPCTFFDNAAMTITSESSPIIPGGGFDGQTGEGEYVLAFDTGVGGGGGGGLVGPSLVFAIAGIGSGSGGGPGGFAPGGGGSSLPPLVELSELVKYSYLGMPLEIEQMILNHDSTVPISPMDIGLFENFDYPLTINDKGFVLGGFTSKIQTQTIKTDSPTVIKFIVYDLTKIQHFSLYTNLRDANSQIHQSDTQILYNDGQELQIKDPNGFFSDVTVTINEINEIKREAVLAAGSL